MLPPSWLRFVVLVVVLVVYGLVAQPCAGGL
jgi:hypothetical protein